MDKLTIKPSPIFPSRVLPSGKSNTTTIRSVGIQGKAGQFIFNNHTDMQKHSHSTIIALQHNNVATAKQMQRTRPPIVVWQ
jgi:hypothetical protein